MYMLIMTIFRAGVIPYYISSRYETFFLLNIQCRVIYGRILHSNGMDDSIIHSSDDHVFMLKNVTRP